MEHRVHDDVLLPRAIVLLTIAGGPPATLLMIVGGWAAVLGVRLGAYLLLGGLFTAFTSHLAMGIWGYRDVMSRPWPKVAPLDEDDDEW